MDILKKEPHVNKSLDKQSEDMISITIIGTKSEIRKIEKVVSEKTRSYKQLATYKKGLTVISENEDQKEFWLAGSSRIENFDTPEKVDHMLKIKNGFIRDQIVVPVKCKKCGLVNDAVQFFVKSLSYKDTTHMDATEYISKAIDDMIKWFQVDTIEDLKQLFFKRDV